MSLRSLPYERGSVWRFCRPVRASFLVTKQKNKRWAENTSAQCGEANMSRIGKMPVHFGKETQVTVGAGNMVTVKGPKTALSYRLNPSITPKVEQGVLTLTR